MESTFFFTNGGLAVLSSVIQPADIALLNPTLPAGPMERYITDEVTRRMTLKPAALKSSVCGMPPSPIKPHTTASWLPRSTMPLPSSVTSHLKKMHYDQAKISHLFSLLNSARTICWGRARRLLMAPTTFWCSQPHLRSDPIMYSKSTTVTYRNLFDILGPYLFFRVSIFSVLDKFTRRTSIQSVIYMYTAMMISFWYGLHICWGLVMCYFLQIQMFSPAFELNFINCNFSHSATYKMERQTFQQVGNW